MKEGVKKYIRKMMTGIMIPVLFMLSGCSEGDMDPLVPARDVSFGNHEKTTVEVLKGNIKPVFEKEITLSGYEESNFRIEQRIMDEYTREYNMKLDGVNVSVGDMVRKGDTLLSFRSDVLEKKRKEWQSAKTSDSLQMEHYKNLMNIDSSYDYTEDCYDLTNDIALANLYIQDIDEIYSAINLISDRDGVVSYVEQSVKDGFLSVGPDIITVSSDDGYYVMDLSSGTDEEAGGEMVDSSSIEFKVGDTFKAKSYMNEYELEVITDPALRTVDDSGDGDGRLNPGLS